MENINEINLPILKEDINQINKCDICLKTFKNRKTMLQHRRKMHGSLKGDDDSYSVNLDEDYEYKNADLIKKNEELKNELMQLILNNPSIDISKNLNHETPLKLINNMTNEELQMRIFDAKKQLTAKMDFKISDGVLNIVNNIIGKMLNCLEELEEEVKKDEVLRQSAKDALSINVLNRIPAHLKLGGLYSLDVARAIAIKKVKTQQLEKIEEKQE